ncbi:BCAS3 microtubule associated cell migration factor-like isoform X2 [Ischnura elegans]|uniref:BCAS3 microtubule associated cell migration factor-like isoform X2 n=1 Tax=Ischnura elegans TaxID=197161 RepID=UPI001ED8B59C|nr:BCAS3 microtubule associated cell migration factor-like isoform X2 [Ischnura elegans]
MSAESPRKTTRHGGCIVSPQPVSGRSIIESVAGFINDVVPQGYVGGHPSDQKDSIIWARFEYSDINDPCLYPEWDRGSGMGAGGDASVVEEAAPPLLLTLGLGGGGAQVWVVAGEDGRAREVLSWRQGMVRTLRILPSPECSPGSPPDEFPSRRPLVALCDSAAPGPPFCSVSFISLRVGEQIKSIKFQNPVVDILANRRVVAVTFLEKIAVFDACTLEDRFTVSSCYPSPGPNPNPVALGSRWMAYTERRLVPSRRSAGGAEGSSSQSYTATVLHAAKSLTRGLRELGESVASSLGGGPRAVARETDRNLVSDTDGSSGSPPQPGVVTILDIWGVGRGETDPMMEEDSGHVGGVIAHFLAHASGDPIVALSFDPSGTLLLTADRAGHDFHVFRIHPGFGLSSSTAVHHLYVLHRGDTTAKVQDIAFSMDSRWVAVSTLRGTAHVFPLTPYGGPVGVRTHTAPHVVNRASRFHRSAGLDSAASLGGDPHSPVTGNSPVVGGLSGPPPSSSVHVELAIPYVNPRLPPFPHPTTITPLARLRQPSLSGSMPSTTRHTSHHPNHPCRLPASAGGSGAVGGGSGPVGRGGSGCRGGGPEESIPLRVTACFAPSRAWVVGSPTVGKDRSLARKAVDSLFVMACHGSLMEYALEPKPAPDIPREKVFDDSPIVLEVCPRARWNLLPKSPHHSPSTELQPPLPASNPLLLAQERAVMAATSSPPTTPLHLLPTAATNPTMASIVGGGGANVAKAGQRGATMSQGAIVPRPHGGNSHCHAHSDERWLSQVEIITHAGPHRRLWMGPQFVFKTYGNCSISGPSFGTEAPDLETPHLSSAPTARHARSDPVGMPGSNRTGPLVPVVIESGSGSSFEQSPRLLEGYGSERDATGNRVPQSGEWRVGASQGAAIGESRIREDLADAMMEGPGLPVRDTGPRRAVEVWFEADREWEEIGFSTPKGRRWILEEERVKASSADVTAREQVSAPCVALPVESMEPREEAASGGVVEEVEEEAMGGGGGEEEEVSTNQTPLVQSNGASGEGGCEVTEVEKVDEVLDDDTSQPSVPRRGRRAKKKKR